MKSKKVAAYTGTKNLYGDMIVAAKSLLIHSDVDEIWLFTEDDDIGYDIPDWAKKIIKIRNVSDQKYFKADGPNMKSGFTYMAMMRATFHKEFPKLDKILSLDVDTIVNDDISDIWGIDMGEDYYLAAVPEYSRSFRDDIYVNIGVALYNLEKLRDGKADEVIKALNEGHYTYLEQDVFNQRCKGKILVISSEYNATNYTDPTNHPKIVHYAGVKLNDWRKVPLVDHYYKIPWEDIRDYRKRTYNK